MVRRAVRRYLEWSDAVPWWVEVALWTMVAYAVRTTVELVTLLV